VTLDAMVRAYLLQGRAAGAAAFLHIVQRLDRDTSGVMVFARSLLARDRLRDQFRKHTVERRYLAIAHGDVVSGTHRTRLVRDRGDGRRGSTSHRDLGKESITHVEVVERLAGATLIACRLETGRTNQIRIHLSEAGHPLLGETLYRKGYLGDVLPAPRVMLHAEQLGFQHPVSGEPLHFEEPMPADMVTVLAALRG
jgi:23S rRNA pseudouridine1911/1915/1917 synthase